MTSTTDESNILDPRLRGHLPLLDGVRGLAVALVVFNHLGTALHEPFTHRADWLFAKLSGSAWLGVDLFFVLSGFLITGILADARGKQHYFRNFYMRRSLRIFPLYYAFLVLVFLVIPATGAVLAEPYEVSSQGWYWLYVSNVLFARWDQIPVATGHLWSLAVEEQFYLVWPLVVLLLAPRRLLALCAALVAGLFVGRIALSLAGVSWVQMYVLTLTRLDALAIGAFIALAARRPAGLERLAARARPVALVAGALSLLVMFYKPLIALVRRVPVESINWSVLPLDPQVQTVRFTLYGLFFGAVLVLALVAARQSLLHRIFAAAPLRTLGKYSYAIYLFHVPLHALADRYRLIDRFLPAWNGLQVPRAIAFYCILLALSTALAWVSWHVYEKHFLKIKDRFAHREYAGQSDRAAREAEREVFASP